LLTTTPPVRIVQADRSASGSIGHVRLALVMVTRLLAEVR